MKKIVQKIVVLASVCGAHAALDAVVYDDAVKHVVNQHVQAGHDGRMNRAALIEEWANNAKKEEERFTLLGKYADVYKQEDAPFFQRHSEGKTQVSVGSQYSYASTAQNASGSQSNMLELLFGSSPVQVRDLLLASKLVEAGVLVQGDNTLGVDGFATTEVQNLDCNKYLNYMADETVLFRASSHRVENSFDITHRIGKSKITLGMHVPVVYAEHKVVTDLEFSQYATATAGDMAGDLYGTSRNGTGYAGVVSAIGTVKTTATTAKAVAVANTADVAGVTNAQTRGQAGLQGVIDTDTQVATLAGLQGGLPNTFMRRYGQNPDRFVKDIFRSKGISEMGGSSLGLGDMQLSLASEFDVRGVERANAGLKITLPTAQQASTSKFFAPELGNGGHAALGFFASALITHNNWINLHGALDCDIFASAEVDIRTPQRIQYTNSSGATASLPANLMAFADRVYAANTAEVNDFDTPFAGVGDNVARLRRSRGTALHARIGNLFTCSHYKRASLDLYYDLRAKLKDSFDGDASRWDTTPHVANSQQLAHTAGASMAYQFSQMARASVGLSHVLAGHNVKKDWNFSALLNISF